MGDGGHVSTWMLLSHPLPAGRKPGRPPAGPGGEAAQDMARVRISAQALERVNQLALERGVPQWRVLEDLVLRSDETPTRGGDGYPVFSAVRRRKPTPWP